MSDAGDLSQAERDEKSSRARARHWSAPWRHAHGDQARREHEIDKLQQALEGLGLGGPCKDFLKWYMLRLRRFEKFAKTNRNLHQWLRIPALVVATVVPAIVAADFGRPGRLIATALGVFVAAAVGVDEFMGTERRWRHYRGIVEVLKAEGWMFLALAGKWKNYGSHNDAFQKFAGDMGSALLGETEQYMRAVAPEPPVGTAGDRGGDQNS